MNRLVVAVLVVTGLTLAGSGVAQLPDQSEPCDYSYSYEETSDGFRIVKGGSIVVGPGGEFAEVTADAAVPASERECRLTTQERTEFTLDKGADQEVIIRAELGYDPGEKIFRADLQQNEFSLRLVGPEGTVGTSENRFDGGHEAIRVDSGNDNLPDGKYWTEVVASRGGAHIQVDIEVEYV